MIEVKFLCPHCSTKILVDEGAFGLQINCPNCGKAMMAPVGRHVPEQKGPACLKVEMPPDMSALEKKCSGLQETITTRQRQVTELDLRATEAEARFAAADKAANQSEDKVRRLEAEFAAKQRQAAQCVVDADMAKTRAQNTLADLEAKEKQLCGVIAERTRQAEEAENRLRTSRETLTNTEEKLRLATADYNVRQRQLADWEDTLKASKTKILDSLKALEDREAHLHNLLEVEQRKAVELEKQAREAEARTLATQNAFEQGQARLRFLTVDLEAKQQQVTECESNLNITKAKTLDSIKELEEREKVLQSLTQSAEEKQRQASALQDVLEKTSMKLSEAEVKLAQTLTALSVANDRMKACELQYFTTFIKPHLPSDLLRHFSGYELGLQTALFKKPSGGSNTQHRTRENSRTAVPPSVSPAAAGAPSAPPQGSLNPPRHVQTNSVPPVVPQAAPPPPPVAPPHTAQPHTAHAQTAKGAVAMMVCPFCKEDIEATASTCKFCREPLAPNAVERAAQTATYSPRVPVRSAR